MSEPNKDVDFEARKTQVKVHHLQFQPRHGRGGSGGGDMEERVTVLEKRMDRFEDKLDRISDTVSRIDAKLDSKVDYKWLTIYVLGIVAVIMRFEIAALFSSGGAP